MLDALQLWLVFLSELLDMNLFFFSVKHEFVLNSHNVQVKKAMEKGGGGGGK